MPNQQSLIDDGQGVYTPRLFDPLSTANVGVTLAVGLLEQPLRPLPPEESFPGAGVYALYYSGSHYSYQRLVSLDNQRFKFPVYIGKAVRENAKQGFSPDPTSKAQLLNRLKDHAGSIEQVSNLSLDDFHCRFLLLEDHHIVLAESVLITTFRPAWNGMGFGSKVVGGQRMTGRASLWDALHPGRGGRPAGDEERAQEADRKVQASIDMLARPPADPVVAAMLEKIMRFV